MVNLKEQARKELLKREAQKELARRNLIDFLVYDGRGNYKTPKHINFICDKVQQAFEGKIKRLIISIPPRHGKSEITTKKAPAWFMGKYPNDELIMASYSQEMINDFSRIARNTLREHEEVFGVQLATDKQSVNEWGLQGTRGTVKASGIGGGLTGKGARVALIDDPHKDWEEAQSKLQRDKVWNWYKSVLRTRLSPDGSIILIMTRWNADDLAGRLLKEAQEGGEEWEEIKIKAIADDSDILGRNNGEALWEERYPLKSLLEIKKTLGSIMFNALYQQSPTNETGSIFKAQYFQYFYDDGNTLYLENENGVKKFMKSECKLFMSGDTATKIKEINDYTVFNTFYVTPDKDILFYDIYKEKIEIPDQYRTLTNVYNRYRHRIIGIEDKQSGTGLIQQGIRDGLPIKALQADTDKVTRSMTISIYYENKKVYHRKNAHWLTDFEEELSSFPFSLHDDIVDTVSNAGIMVQNDSTDIGILGFGKRK